MSGTLTPLAELVVAATVGTAHRPVDVAGLPAPVRPDPLPPEPAFALLDAAALAALARRTSPPLRPVPAACATTAGAAATLPEPERFPGIPEAVRQVLGRLGGQPDVLVEALTLVADAGLRLPADLLPGLLDDPRPEVAAAARRVGGEIGRWLTTRNPRWAAPAEPDPTDPAVWDEGSTAARVAWLRALRRVDPAAARERLAHGLAREPAAARAEFVAVLADRLTAADEDLLVRVAADRSRPVADQSLELLARLPDSALARDMASLAARHLAVERPRWRTAIRVTRPGPDEFAPWPAPVGDPWAEVLRRIDPARWPQVFGADLLALVADGRPELEPLWPGFRLAAIGFGHAALAATLVRGQLVAATARTPPVVDPVLWAVLHPADVTDLLDRLLADRRVGADQVATLTGVFPRPWPTPLARRFAGWLPAGGSGSPAPRTLWERWAGAVDLPECRPMADLVRNLVAATDRPTPLVTRASTAVNLLTLRAVVYETLGRPGGPT